MESDHCLRCDYDLRGIDNTQPCPECGLLAERSRRVSDELHDTRPRWLRSLSIGVWLILLAIAALVALPFWAIAIMESLRSTVMVWGGGNLIGLLQWYLLPWVPLDVAAVALFVGAILLTLREGYPPADAADRQLRRWLRVAASLPLIALLLSQLQGMHDAWYGRARYPQWHQSEIAAVTLAILGCIPLPWLLFLRLNGLAKRARSAHLAEHCMILGAGSSVAVAYSAVAWLLLYKGNEWFGRWWSANSPWSLALMLGLLLFMILFVLWSLYLLIRFAIAFWKASRALRRKWKTADASAGALSA